MKKQPNNVIQNNTFTGVQWDADAVEAVKMVAEALIINSKAIVNMTNLFNSQNINIEMIKINSDRTDLMDNTINKEIK